MADATSTGLACPKCASPMIRRTRRSDRAPFWGCSRYPQCHGTRDIGAIDAVRPATEQPERGAVPWDDPSWHRGVAGGSARAAFERRSARHKAATRRRRPEILLTAGVMIVAGVGLTGLGSTWPLLGWSLVFLAVVSALAALFILPDNIRSWDTGADGEVATADALAILAEAGFVVLHDRRIPGSRANIDHIVIGPPGVFVVETKSYGGELRVRSGELFVNGRRRTNVIDQVTRQAAVVSEALDAIPVGRIVCVHRADFPLFWRPTLDGVPIVDRRGLIRLLREAPPRLDSEEVSCLAHVAATRLPPAFRATRLESAEAPA